MKRQLIIYGWLVVAGFTALLEADPLSRVYPNSNAKDVLADCPWRLEPDRNVLPVMIQVKDAGDNIADYDIEYVSVRYDGQEIYRRDYHFKVTNQVYNLYQVGDWYDIIEVPTVNLPRNQLISLIVKIKENGEWYDPDGDTEMEIRTWLSDYPLPQLPEWKAGDIHFHSHLTDNEFEFGGPAMMAKTAGRAIGLGYITLTDHAVDMNATKYNYMMRLCDSLSDTSLVLLAGEEVSAKNYEGHYLHTLVYNQKQHIVGSEISAPGYTREGYYIHEIVSRMLADSAYLFIAHPEIGQFRWEIPLFGWSIDRGMTRDQDYMTPGLHGIQIWNTRRQIENWYENLITGLDKWRGLLAEGRRIVISAGSDAHGDFSYSRLYTTSSYPNVANDWSNAMGRVRTYLYSPSPSPAILHRALQTGQSICSDGPLTELMLVQDNDTTRLGHELLVDSPNPRILIRMISTPEFGRIDSCLLIQGHIFPSDSQIDDWFEVPVNMVSEPVYLGSLSLPLLPRLIPGQPYTLRLEANTDLAMDGITHRCYTNPIWVRRIKNDSTDLIPVIHPKGQQIECRLDLKSEAWATIGLYRLNGDSLIKTEESVNPFPGSLILNDRMLSDSLPPFSAGGFHVDPHTPGPWYRDSILSLSWNPGIDRKDTLYYCIKAMDRTGYSYSRLRNGGLDLVDTAGLSMPLDIVYDQCVYSPDPDQDSGRNWILTASAPWDGPSFRIPPLTDTQSYWVGIRSQNRTNRESAGLAFFLNPGRDSTQHLYTQAIPSDQQWHSVGFRLIIDSTWNPTGFPPWEIQWSIGEQFESGQAWFDDFEILPMVPVEFYSHALRYRISAYDRGRLIHSVEVIDSNSATVHFPWEFNREGDSLYLVLETFDQSGNLGADRDSIGPLWLDITPPVIQNVEWDVIPESHRALNRYPSETIVLASLDTVRIRARLWDQISGIHRAQIRLISPIDQTTDFPMLPVSSQDSTWQIKLIPVKGWNSLDQDTVTAVIWAIDSAGNRESYSLPPFRIESLNRAPAIIGHYPPDTVLWLNAGDSIQLRIEAEDADRDSLRYEWIMNGERYPGLPESLMVVMPADPVPDWRITARVSDGRLSDSVTWMIHPVVSSITSGSRDRDSLHITVFPNPTNNFIGIRVTAPSNGIMTYDLINMLGVTCLKGHLAVNQGEQACWVDLTGLPSGIYLVRLQLDSQFRVIKITKIL
ncbi:MAG: T9SS type A sorting domain-containing protein [Candidatus Delongbacteria bacterium]|nr:T9SS type A sorting domain-containing protein [Candidatus Delongbacteria bacterium]